LYSQQEVLIKKIKIKIKIKNLKLGDKKAGHYNNLKILVMQEI